MRLFKNKIWIYVFGLFVFTLIFSLFIPMGGDDWGNYLQKGLSFLDIINKAKHFYLIWEGRFFSRICLALLVPHEVIWAFVNASVMSLLFYFMYKILGIKEHYLPLLLMCILFVDFETYAQVYVWRTGNITYLIPMVYAFVLIFIRRQNLLDVDTKIHKYDYLLLPFTFIFSVFVENVTIGIIFICLLNVIVYYLKSKKIDVPMLLNLIVAIIGFCIMYFSPGTQFRANFEGEFNSLSILEKIIYNIPNLINYTFIKNSFLTFLFVLVMSIITKRNIKNKLLQVLLLFFIIIPAGLTLFVNVLAYFFTLPDLLLKVLNYKNVFIDIYWIIFIFVFLFLIIYYLKANKAIVYFIILAVVSNGAMMFSPVWGGRTACFTTFMLYMALVFIILKLDLQIFNNKKIIMFMRGICLQFMIVFMLYSVYIHDLNIDRNKYINYQIENNAKEYEIIILPGYYTWNLNTWGSDGDFAYNFKAAYGINKEAPLIYVFRDDVKINIDKLDISSDLRG